MNISVIIPSMNKVIEKEQFIIYYNSHLELSSAGGGADRRRWITTVIKRTNPHPRPPSGGRHQARTYIALNELQTKLSLTQQHKLY